MLPGLQNTRSLSDSLGSCVARYVYESRVNRQDNSINIRDQNAIEYVLKDTRRQLEFRLGFLEKRHIVGLNRKPPHLTISTNIRNVVPDDMPLASIGFIQSALKALWFASQGCANMRFIQGEQLLAYQILKPDPDDLLGRHSKPLAVGSVSIAAA